MSLNSNLKEILKSFRQRRILIVGDVMVDEYLWGHVSRISPEAPVPVVSCTEREYRMGGAANVAINVAAMNAEPVLCSVIGDDEAGAVFYDLLRRQNMTDTGILNSPHRKTTIKTRVIGNHQHLLRVDHEITEFLNVELEELLIGKVSKLLSSQKFDAIILQDYDKGILTRRIIEEIADLGSKLDLPVLVDPKKRNFLTYRNVTLFKPNYKELVEGLNIMVKKDSHNSLIQGVKPLHEKNKIKFVMVTLSEKGVFVSDGTDSRIIPAIERDIADVSGAGDTVICIAALCLATGLDLFQTAELSNLAGGIVCEKVGVVPVTTEMLLSEKSKLL